jgi:hypothetical protein
MRGPETRSNQTSRRNGGIEHGPDAFGVALALGVGALVGLFLGLPALPSGSVAVVGLEIDAVGAVLLASALSVLVVPFGTYVLYQLFFLAER